MLPSKCTAFLWKNIAVNLAEFYVKNDFCKTNTVGVNNEALLFM